MHCVIEPNNADFLRNLSVAKDRHIADFWLKLPIEGIAMWARQPETGAGRERLSGVTIRLFDRLPLRLCEFPHGFLLFLGCLS